MKNKVVVAMPGIALAGCAGRDPLLAILIVCSELFFAFH